MTDTQRIEWAAKYLWGLSVEKASIVLDWADESGGDHKTRGYGRDEATQLRDAIDHASEIAACWTEERKD